MQNRVIMPVKDELTEAQADFLRSCKELGWGKLEVTVQDGEPAFSRVLEVTHKHKH